MVDTNILLRRTRPDHEDHSLVVENVALLPESAIRFARRRHVDVLSLVPPDLFGA